MAADLSKALLEDAERVIGGQDNWTVPEDLDAVVADEPNHQPQLRRLLGSSALAEPWKPTTTVKEFLMASVELPSSVSPEAKKGLIYDHREIRLSPYLPHAWVGRAGTFLTLGYGELAAADAYRCRLLCQGMSMETYLAWKGGSGGLTSKVIEAIASKSQQRDFEFAEIRDEINVTEERAWLVMAQGLMSIRAWYDAATVLGYALEKYPSNSMFQRLLAKVTLDLEELKLDLEKLMKDYEAKGQDTAPVQKTMSRGRVDRVAYPWIVPEEFTRGTKAIKKLKARFKSAAKKAEIAPSGLGDTTDGNYGVFATDDIDKGEQILLDKSIYASFNTIDDSDCSACCQPLYGSNVAVDCCKARFCTESCKAEALSAYHRILCGKDLSWLYAACKDADVVTNKMIPLLMVKVLATAIQHNAKPLKVACVGTLNADYQKPTLSFFKLFDNIIAPTKILQFLGVDIFTDMRFDSWALQTLFVRIENNKRGENFGNRRYSGIKPLFSMLNHICYPATTWHSIDVGGAIEVVAMRDIKKGEEICISYTAPWLQEAERRRKILTYIGKVCECDRCVYERSVAAIDSNAEVLDLSRIRQDIVNARIASQTRHAGKH